MSIYVWHGFFILSGIVVTLAINLTIESLDDPARIVRLRRSAAWVFIGMALTGILFIAFGLNTTPVALVTLGALLADLIFALTNKQPLFYNEHDH
jgi:uncharacterized membrane protein YphA (DoxX/SURF4 family)